MLTVDFMPRFMHEVKYLHLKKINEIWKIVVKGVFIWFEENSKNKRKGFKKM